MILRLTMLIITLSHKALEALKMDKDKYIYGTINGQLSRINRKTKDAEFILWSAGEQGHKVDFWHEYGDGHKTLFISGYPLEIERSNRLEF